MPSLAPAPLRFACELVDATGQSVEVRASFQEQAIARSFVNRNPPPPGYASWRIRNCETGNCEEFPANA